MRNNHKQSKLVLVIVFLLAWGLGACAGAPTAAAQAWIDYPPDGDTLALGAPVTVISHAFAREGVSEVVLSVNGEAYRRDVPEGAGDDFVSMRQVWAPVEAGSYTLQVQAYDRQGGISNPATVNVEVLGEAQAPLPSPTLVVTATPVDTLTPVPTATEVVTVIPVISVTPVITVTSPPPAEPPPPVADTQAPPAPAPAVPANGLELACRATQTLAWLPVDDPSGISGYYVKLEMEVKAGEWQAVAGYGPIPDKQVGVNVDCGVRYRWMVRAQDGVGNLSNWSAPSTFSIVLN
jgi:hypothetical protein